jgi:predicted nucleotidyltransferase
MIRKRTDEIVEKFIKGIEAAGLKRSIEKMYLFGSRARGDDRPDSDYDILVVAGNPDTAFKDKIYDVVLDVLFETRKGISLKIFQTSEFRRLKRLQIPFMRNVLREGVRVG